MRPFGGYAARTDELTPVVVCQCPGPGKPGSARTVKRRVFAMLHCVP